MSTEFIPPPLWDQFRGTYARSSSRGSTAAERRRVAEPRVDHMVAFSLLRQERRDRAHLTIR
jgi:hypothetical protein